MLVPAADLAADTAFGSPEADTREPSAHSDRVLGVFVLAVGGV